MIWDVFASAMFPYCSRASSALFGKRLARGRDLAEPKSPGRTPRQIEEAQVARSPMALARYSTTSDIPSIA